MYFAAASGAEITAIDLTHIAGSDQQKEIEHLRRVSSETLFDLANGPVFTAVLVHLADDRHELIFTTHHTICDGWSIRILVDDLRLLYLAHVDQVTPTLLPPQSISQLSAAEALWVTGGGAARDLAFWKAKFSDVLPVVDMPTDRPRPKVKTASGAQRHADIGPILTKQLQAMARQHGVPVESIIFAAFNAFIARLTGSDDIVLGLPVAGQLAHGLERVVGHSANLIPIRNRVDMNDCFANFLAQVRQSQLDAFEHKKTTLGVLLRHLKVARDPSRIPLTPIAMSFTNVIDAAGLVYPSLDARLVWHERPYEHFELFAYVTLAANHIGMEWSFNTDLFDATTIEGHMDRFVRLLAGLVGDPNQPLGDISLISAEDKKALARAARPESVPVPAEPVHALFELQAARTPEATALVLPKGFGGAAGRLTYRSLNARANRVARGLLARGVQPGDLVGIALDRGADMLAALIGVAKAGAGYVPLDPAFPPARIAYMLQDSDVRLVIADASTRMLAGAVPVFDPQGDLPVDNSNLGLEVPPTARAYVLYTSGSTGRPKGVEITHHAFVNFLTSMIREPGLSATDRLLAITTLSFDIAGLELWGPLVSGGALVMARREDAVNAPLLADLITDEKVTILQATPSTWRMLMDAGWQGANGLKALSGGEPLPLDLARRLAPQVAALWNLYGPTETTVWSTLARILPDATSVPIGLPIANTEIVVLDSRMHAVPPGASGELFIGGEGLALGYLGRPDLTADRFIPHPLDAAARLYRTGDMARWAKTPDGGYVLECLGRADNQIKLRGYRIEPEEIETRLEALPELRQAAVVLREDVAGDQRLIAYMVPQGVARPDATTLVHALAADLPRYMVPSRFVWCDALPLTPNGKTDRLHLARQPLADVQDRAQNGGRRDAGSATQAERDMHAIWIKTLNLTDISMEDDFFELGGHSLLAVKLFAEIKRKFGADMPISTLFAHPTIRDLARRVQTAGENALPVAHAGAPEDAPWDTTAVIHPGPGTKAQPLFIVSGVGGNVNNLVQLGRTLGRHRALIGLQTRGILGHRMHESIEATAADHLINLRRHQPEGPYLLAGYSGGAYAAYEMARQLRAAGEDVGFLGLLDTSAPQFACKKFRTPFARIGYTIRLLRRHGPKPIWTNAKVWLQNKLQPELMVQVGAAFAPEKFRHVQLTRQWWKISECYAPGPYDGDAWLFVTESDRDGFVVTQMRRTDPEYGWRAFILGHLRVSRHWAGHLSMMTGTAVVELADMIETEINHAKHEV